MSSRPDPPYDCEEVNSYSKGDQVYYFFGGIYNGPKTVAMNAKTTVNVLGKWRAGLIQGEGGSSDESPRYLVCQSSALLRCLATRSEPVLIRLSLLCR